METTTGYRRHATTIGAVRALIRAFSRESTTGCWEWLGAIDGDGYGDCKRLGTRGAHRVAYTAFVGPIPDGLQIDHLCRVRSCVNPDHLEPVTARENSLRSPFTAAHRNSLKTHCHRGHLFTEENTSTRNRKRECKICMRDYQALRRAAAKLQAGAA